MHRTIQALKNRTKSHYILYIVVILNIFLTFFGNSAFAESMQTNVRIRPSLTFTIPVSSITMSLNPASKPFDTKTIPITVGTNNESGYQVFVNATDTRLINTEDPTYTIPTLTNSGYTDSNFPANYWGYKLDGGGYQPFVSGSVVSSAGGPVNEQTTNMVVASKIDYLQEPGTYKLALNFSIVPIVSTNYMQSMNPAECTETPMVIADQRDGIPYTVRRLADGNCWMVENLRFTGTRLSSATSNVAAQYTDANPYLVNGTGSYKSLAVGDNSYNDAELIAGMDNKGESTVWYNYVAATAGTITGSSNSNEAEYSICPSGWRLPNDTEYTNLVNLIGDNPATFTPTGGGTYDAGAVKDSPLGTLWSSTPTQNVIGNARYTVYYNSNYNKLVHNGGNRYYGFFVRCILDTKTIVDATYLQDVTPAMSRNTTVGTTTDLIDIRDGQTYKVAKLADGQIWMTSNLNLAGGTTLYSDDSDVAPANTRASGTPYYTLPDGNGYSGKFSDNTVAYVYNTGNETTSQADCTSTQPCNSYYSWLAATAGGKDASGTAVTGNGPDAAYSICPKGWRLPKSGNDSDTSATSTTGYKKGDFYKLATAYGANLESSNLQNSAVFYNNAGPGTLPNFLLAGLYYSSTFAYGGSYGSYWSSSSYSSTSAYRLTFSSSLVNSAESDYRRVGFPVRCVFAGN